MQSSTDAAKLLDDGVEMDARDDLIKKQEKGLPLKLVDPELVGKAAKSTVTMSKWLLQGSYLPMFSDKVRNSVKCRPLLVLCYILAASLVAGFVVANFYVREVRRFSIQFSVRPQETFQLGAPLAPFSVEVKDQNNKPLVGRQAYATVVPIDELVFDVTIGDIIFEVNRFRCIPDVLFPLTSGFHNKLPFCSPQTASNPATPLFVGRDSVTDDRGIARFENANMLLGVRGTYLLVVGTMDCSENMESCVAIPELFVTSYISTEPDVVQMKITDFYLPIVPEEDFPTELPLNIEGFPPSDDWIRGLPGIKATVEVHFTAEHVPTVVAGVVLPLPLLRSPTPRSYAIPFFPKDTNDPVATIGNAYALTEDITALGNGEYLATMNFSNVAVLGANTKQMYLGVYVLGHLIPLYSPLLTASFQKPNTFLLPYTLRTPVTTVEIVENPIDANGGLIREGDPFGIVVRVRDSAGRPLPDRAVHLELLPSSKNEPRSYNEAATHPAMDQKKLVFNEGFTDGEGLAYFSGTRTSVAHAPGFYDLRVTCDGVNAMQGDSILFPLEVKSRVVSIELRNTDHATPENVGNEWLYAPYVLVKDASGKAIPGKTAVLRVRDEQRAAVIAAANPSGDDGISYFYTVNVAFAADSTVRFEVLVDNVVLATFNRTLVHLRSSTEPLPTAFVRLASIPPQPTYSGTMYEIVAESLDEFGRRVPGDVLGIEVTREFIKPPPGNESTVFFERGNSSGLCIFRPAFGPSLRHYTAVSQLFSTASPSRRYPIMMTFISRVLDVHAEFKSDPDGNHYILVNVDALWDEVTPTNPLVVSAASVWAPSFAENYMPQEIPRTDYKLLHEPQEIRLDAVNTGVLAPGLYYFCVVVSFATYLDDKWEFGGLYGTYLPAIDLPIPPTVGSLEVIVPAFSANMSSIGEITFGRPLPRQPRVRVFGFSGQPLSHVRLMAQLGVVRGTASNRTIHWLDEQTNELDLGFAKICNVNEQNTPGVSNYSEYPSGDAQFNGLGILGARGGTVLAIRYCANLWTANFGPDVLTVPFFELCVEEEAFYRVPVWESSAAIVTPTRAAASPGVVVPPFTVRQYNYYGTSSQAPLVGAACTVQWLTPGQSFLGVTQQFSAADTRIATNELHYGEAPTATLEIQNMLIFNDNTPDGTYLFQFVCVGSSTGPIAVTVTSTPGDISVTSPPPPALTLNRMINMDAVLFATSGAPMRGGLQYSIRPAGKRKCLREACGVLTADSEAFHVTDERGAARFHFALTTAEAGEYDITVGVAPVISSQGTLQEVRLETTLVTTFFGVSRDDLLPFVRKTSMLPGMGSVDEMVKENMVEILDILFAISDLASTASATAPKAGEEDDSNFLERFFTHRKPVTAKVRVMIANPVASIEITREPRKSISLPPPPAVTTPITDGPRDVVARYKGDEAAQLIMRDADGHIIRTRQELTITMLPEGGGGSVLPHQSTAFPFDPDTGLYTLTDLPVRFTAPGSKYQLSISSNGGGLVTTEKFVVSQGAGKTLSQVMKQAAFLVFAIFTPLLIATVPHAHPAFTGLSLVLSIGVIVAAAVLANEYLKYLDNVYIKGYCILVIVLAIVTGVLQQVVVVLDFIGVYGKKYGLRFLNDEQRTFKIFQYARWITNVRIEKQQEQLCNGTPMGTVGTTAAKIADRVGSIQNNMKQRVDKVVDSIDNKLDLGVVDHGSPNRVRRKDRPPLIYDPEIDATYTPINFMVVCGISIVLVALVTFLMIYIYHALLGFLNDLMGYLPDAQDMEDMSMINSLVISVTIQSFGAIASTFPRYQFLANWAARLKDINVIAFLADLRSLIEDLANRLSISLYIAVGVADFAVLACMASIYIVIPSMIRDIRRGKLRKDVGVGPGEPYIGLHCFHFIMMHQLIVWPLVLVILMATIAAVRIFVWEQSKIIIIASITGVVIQFALQKVLVGWFLSEGWRVIRPEFYSIWHFIGLILGIFTGIIKTIVRYVQSIVFITILFPRLDFTIFPVIFAPLDKAHLGFCSIVVVEAKANNPIGLLFSTLLLTEFKCRLLATQNAKTATSDPEKLLIDIDTFGSQRLAFNEPLISAAIMKNLIRVYLRSLVPGNSLHLNEAPAHPAMNISHFNNLDGRRSRHERVRNRFWLGWLLHQNPSLQKLRKQYLYLHPDEVASQQQGATVGHGATEGGPAVTHGNIMTH